MDLADLIILTRKGWALPVLAALGRGVPARTYTLVRAYPGASRAAVGEGLTHLVDLGLLAPNPGHGHPLRPEFLIPEDALGVPAWAAAVWSAVDAAQVADLCRKRWSLPVLQVLTSQPSGSGFARLQRALAPVTARGLSLALAELEAHGLVSRMVLSDRRPPASNYSLTPQCRTLAAVLTPKS